MQYYGYISFVFVSVNIVGEIIMPPPSRAIHILGHQSRQMVEWENIAEVAMQAISSFLAEPVFAGVLVNATD